MNEIWQRELQRTVFVALILLAFVAGAVFQTLRDAGEIHDLAQRVAAYASRHCVWWDPHPQGHHP